MKQLRQLCGTVLIMEAVVIALADEAVAETGPGSGGVLITGSVITAGDARRLLAPAGGELPAEPPASQPSRHSFTAAELS